MSEIYMDAMSIAVEHLPDWVVAWSIHPEDRGMYDGPPIEQYSQGARILCESRDGQRELVFSECVGRLEKTVPHELLHKFMEGTETPEDADMMCQYAVFGEIRYPAG